MRARVLVATAFLFGLLAALAAVPTEQRRAERLQFLLRYIGTDYGIAVQDGRVINDFEYREMTRFSRIALDEYRDLRGIDAAPETVEDLERLRAGIDARASWDHVQALSGTLVAALGRELGLDDAPAGPPDPERGRALYAADCAVCHGPRGAGDGRAAAGMDPPPTSFRDRVRMSLLSPAHVKGAVDFGVDGTAMPSFDGAYTTGELWDIAAYVLALPDEGGAPRAEVPDDSTEPGLRMALELEAAFTRVAESAFPSVAGVSVYRRKARVSAPRSGDPPESGWQQALQDEPYPGYERVRSRSGVFVTNDGYLLTCAHWLADVDDAPQDRILDVEMHDNVHARAWIVGLEPAVDLAVLKAESPIRTTPARMVDAPSVRVGEWAIAIGDPPGVERTFVVSTISATPRRDCYQESRSSTLFQTAARLGAESLCGPLVDVHGAVVGITVPDPRARLEAQMEETLAYALPSDLARTLFEALREKGSRRSPWLGIAVLNLTPDLRRRIPGLPTTGLYVEDVYVPSPASRAGIRVGDVLVALGGQRLFAVQDFQKWLYLTGIGRNTTLEIVRDGTTVRHDLIVEERPASIPAR